MSVTTSDDVRGHPGGRRPTRLRLLEAQHHAGPALQGRRDRHGGRPPHPRRERRRPAVLLRWRTRSGCYFCFYQRKAEWVGLLEKHPDLFEAAKEYEKFDPETGERYTWTQKESLEELASPERVAEIKERHLKSLEAKQQKRANLPLLEVLNEVLEDENDEQACSFCHL